MRSSVDLPQPDGPISDTNSPGASARSMSCSAVTLPRGKTFVTFSIRTTDVVAHPTFSGARRTMSFSAMTMVTKKKIPRSAAAMFVAQSSCGSIE